MRTATALALAVVVLLSLPVVGQGPIRVFVDSEEVRFDVPPVEVGGRILVPLRGIFERLGAAVTWQPAQQRVIAASPNGTIELVIGQRQALVDNRPVPLDVPAMVIAGRTMVPLRFVAEALGAAVQFDAASRSVFIFSQRREPPPGAGQPPRPPAPPAPAPPPPQAQAIEGVLVTVDAAGDRIQVQSGSATFTIVITPQTAIFRTDVATGTGGATALSSLRPGDQVRVEITPQSEAVSVRASHRTVKGKVDLVTATAIALQGGGVFTINANAAFVVNGAAAPLGQITTRLRRDDEVTLRVNPATNEVWEIQATTAAAPTPPPPSTQTVRAFPAADATVDESAPSVPFAAAELRAGRTPGGRVRALVRFSLPSLPSGATIVSVRLRLFFYAYYFGSGDTFSVYRVLLPWGESVTWNGQPLLLPGAPADSAAVAPVPLNRAIEWDVTGLVRDWYAGGANFGVMLRGSESGFAAARFGPREGPTGQRPMLIITYREP